MIKTMFIVGFYKVKEDSIVKKIYIRDSDKAEWAEKITNSIQA